MGRGGTVNLMELLVAFKGLRLDSLMAEGFLEAFSAQDHWYQADAARHKKRATPSGWPFLFATCCLVEPAGIEPASVSNPSADLHA